MTCARLFVAALVALVAACATPGAMAPLSGGPLRSAEPLGDAQPVVASSPAEEDAGPMSVAPASTAAPAPSRLPAVDPSVVGRSGHACATTQAVVDHPLALALARDLKTPFATYACVFHSATDPDVAVPGFRVRALAAAAPFGPLKSYGDRRWAFVERYAAELGLSASPRQELVLEADELGFESLMFMAGISHLFQRVSGTWIRSNGALDLELGVGAAPVVTSIDFAIIAHPERLAQGKRVSRQIAQEAAWKAARADGAIPGRLAKKPSLALRTTASGTALVYDFTIVKVVLTVGGFGEDGTWLIRVDAATGKVASLHHAAFVR